MRSLLLDSCVLIDYLRDRPEAVAYLEGLDRKPLISALTVAELYAGVREGRERTVLNALTAGLEVVAVDRAIAERGGLLRRDYGRSHGVGVVDAIIAATAIAQGAVLVTRNAKHFPMVEDLVVPYR
jgi:predicted nucleic acid-binding protein